MYRDAVEVVVKLIISLEHDGEDILVGQAKSFLENTFNACVYLISSKYTHTNCRVTVFLPAAYLGFFARCMISHTLGNISLTILMKRTLDREFFLVVKNITSKSKTQSLDGLRDALLRDALQNAADNEPKVCEIMLGNIHTYIEVAHHEHYTAEMMQGASLCMKSIYICQRPG